MTYDCIVIGGGPAGSAAAFMLARSQFRVLVIDRLLRKPKYKIGESLSGQGVHLLKRSGLVEWARRSRPLDNPGDLSSWETEELISKDFIFDAYGNGWHLDRVAFDASLQQAASFSGAIFSDANIRHAKRNRDSTWTVHISGGPLRARWLIDASGRHGVLSRILGIKRVKDSPLIAVHSWGRNRSGEVRTIVEAVSGGWWYSAPLPGDRRVAAMHTTPEYAKLLLQNPDSFAEAMKHTRHLSRHCSFDETWERPRGIDASGSALATIGDRGWMAIGDAAMTFDPLSSHGITNALAHGVFGAEAIAEALRGSYSSCEALLKDIVYKRDNYLKALKQYYYIGNRWEDFFWKEKCYGKN